MKVIYICGPFSAATAWDIEQNVRRAEEMALVVAKLGAMPVCPHANTRYFHGQCTEEFWYEGTLELMRRCDGVLTTAEGWYNSKGAKWELEEARKLGLPVFYNPKQLEEWLHVQRVL